MTSYVELKLSWELHKCPPEALNAEARKSLTGIAARQKALEKAILSSPEAMVMIVTEEAIAARLTEIRNRYDSDTAFVADLARIGLDLAGLEAELARDLRVEATLESVSHQAPLASETDAEIFYRVNAARFAMSERRTLRHILVTFNSPDERIKTRRTLAALREQATSVQAFADLALRHSQCPTALEGGALGVLPLGKLFKELDVVAFELGEGEVSPPTESSIGWHLLRCDAIHPGSVFSYEAVRGRILEGLNDSRRKRAQREWIKRISRSAPS